VEICPPYSLDLRFASTTMAMAFQRMYASMRRSIARSPGYGGSWAAAMVLT